MLLNLTYQILVSKESVSKKVLLFIAGFIIFTSAYFHTVKEVEVLINDSNKLSAKQKEKTDNWLLLTI